MKFERIFHASASRGQTEPFPELVLVKIFRVWQMCGADEACGANVAANNEAGSSQAVGSKNRRSNDVGD